MSEPAPSADPQLLVDQLKVEFVSNRGGVVPAVRGVSLRVGARQIVGVVGESGSGKSVTALTVLRLLHPRARVVSGQVRFGGVDVLTASEREMQAIRGKRISLVPQDALTAMNPAETVGGQLVAGLRTHDRDLDRGAARELAVEALRQVELPEPAAMFHRYPFELSGGQRQRAVIALALAGRPTLLIADEPTTALDVTTQRRILTLLRKRAEAEGLSVMLITHDLGVVAEVCEYVYVMRRGSVVEHGAVDRVLEQPRDPYTVELIESFPDPDRRDAPLGRPGFESATGVGKSTAIELTPGEAPSLE